MSKQRRNRYGFIAALLVLAACASPRSVYVPPQAPRPLPMPTPAPIPAPAPAPTAAVPPPGFPQVAPVQPGVAKPLSLVAAQTGVSAKVIVGYQGWFGCPGDFEGNTGWRHWFLANDAPDQLTVEQIPSTRGIDDRDLCLTSLKRPDGAPIKLFSSQNPRVVATHFRWMREHNIDGAAAQRFVVEMDDPASHRRLDNVMRNVRAAAEASGRVFFVTYDISGANPATVIDQLRRDWRHLVNTLKLTESPNYLHDRGKPMLQLWGFGFEGRPGEAQAVQTLIDDLKVGRDGLRAVTLIGGVPSHWRTLTGDAKPDAAWARVYRSYDVISPWSVGRFGDDNGAALFVRNFVAPDLAETRRLGIGYMPVMFPGFSWYNLMTQRGQKSAAIENQIPRRCGNFMWQQAGALMTAGVDSIYAAMFDEVDEATSLFPTESSASSLPVNSKMVYLNQDGCALPEDFYLRVTGKVAEHLKKRQVPPRDLGRVVSYQ
jgi:hypothetical protein